jgi:hypothetical protein
MKVAGTTLPEVSLSDISRAGVNYQRFHSLAIKSSRWRREHRLLSNRLASVPETSRSLSIVPIPATRSPPPSAAPLGSMRRMPVRSSSLRHLRATKSLVFGESSTVQPRRPRRIIERRFIRRIRENALGRMVFSGWTVFSRPGCHAASWRGVPVIDCLSLWAAR